MELLYPIFELKEVQQFKSKKIIIFSIFESLGVFFTILGIELFFFLIYIFPMISNNI